MHDKVLTAANGITAIRLMGLPLFVWLVVGPERLALAFGVLALVATTDWVDGYVARRFDQVTRLGRLLDPLIDRAMLATAGLTMAAVGILPWWIVLVIVARDAALLVVGVALFRGIPTIPVSRTGKFATACLLFGVPAFLLAAVDWPGARVAQIAAWTSTLTGIAAYYVAGWQYAVAARSILRARRTA